MWIYILRKLFIELIKVTPYSIVNVKLAVQALRSTVSKVLLNKDHPNLLELQSFVL